MRANVTEHEEKMVELKNEIERVIANGQELKAANDSLSDEKHQLTNSIKEMEETNKNAVQNQVITLYFLHVHE